MSDLSVQGPGGPSYPRSTDETFIQILQNSPGKLPSFTAGQVFSVPGRTVTLFDTTTQHDNAWTVAWIDQDPAGKPQMNLAYLGLDGTLQGQRTFSIDSISVTDTQATVTFDGRTWVVPEASTWETYDQLKSLAAPASPPAPQAPPPFITESWGTYTVAGLGTVSAFNWSDKGQLAGYTLADGRTAEVANVTLDKATGLITLWGADGIQIAQVPPGSYLYQRLGDSASIA